MRMLAFPRGINVGGRTVPMARLRTLLADGGFEGVRTVLASGNVAFEPPTTLADDVASARVEVERLMSEEFGFEAIVQVYPAEAVARCVDEAPWGEAPDGVHHYLVLVDDADVRATLLAAEPGPQGEAVAPAELGVFWRVAKGQTITSGFGALIGTARIKRHVTTRKIDTLRKLLA